MIRIQRLRFMASSFWREPAWFRILVMAALLASIVLSSSVAADIEHAQRYSKAAAAVFFGTFGVKLRANRMVSVVFILLALLCVYLAWRVVR